MNKKWLGLVAGMFAIAMAGAFADTPTFGSQTDSAQFYLAKTVYTPPSITFLATSSGTEGIASLELNDSAGSTYGADEATSFYMIVTSSWVGSFSVKFASTPFVNQSSADNKVGYELTGSAPAEGTALVSSTDATGTVKAGNVPSAVTYNSSWKKTGTMDLATETNTEKTTYEYEFEAHGLTNFNSAVNGNYVATITVTYQTN